MVSKLPSDQERKRSHLEQYDYSTPGAYFITICCFEMRSIFGRVDSGGIRLNDLGKLAESELASISKHHNAMVDTWMVMPNHIHALLFIDPVLFVESLRCMDLVQFAKEAALKPIRPMPVIWNLYKQSVTRGIRVIAKDPNYLVIQRGYYEHIVRDDEDLATRRNYILTNPLRWELKRIRN